jgi:hypothetical protein
MISDKLIPLKHCRKLVQYMSFFRAYKYNFELQLQPFYLGKETDYRKTED